MNDEAIKATWMRELDHHSPVPLYQQLIDLLEEQINNGVFTQGEALPSEHKLQAAFKVSRSVVRQALAVLAQKGLIYTEHGRGSFISQQKIVKPLDILQSYTYGMARSNIDVDVQIIKKELVFPPPEVAQMLEVQKRQKVFHLHRLACVDDNPLNILDSYITTDQSRLEKLMEFPGGSLYEYLQSQVDIRLVRSRSYLEVTNAAEMESRALQLARGSVLLQLMSVVYDRNNQPVEFTRIVYPGHRFQFWFESYIVSEENKDPKRYISTG